MLYSYWLYHKQALIHIYKIDNKLILEIDSKQKSKCHNKNAKDNLISNNERSPIELKENGRRGGIQSGKVRQKIKGFKEAIRKILLEQSQENSDETNLEIICRATVENAKAGDSNARNFCVTISGLGSENIDKTKRFIRDFRSNKRSLKETVLLFPYLCTCCHPRYFRN